MLIPRKFHFFWTGQPMPKVYTHFVQSWQDLHPDWKVTLWTIETLPPLQNRWLYDAAHLLVPAHMASAFQSDLVRLEVLKWFGGVWLDVDFEPLQNIEPLIFEAPAFVFSVPSTDRLNNSPMGFPPDHPMMDYMVRGADQRMAEFPEVPTGTPIGPRWVTGLVNEFPDVMVLSGHHVMPYSMKDITNNTVPSLFGNDVYAVHHWNHKREMSGKPLVRILA